MVLEHFRQHREALEHEKRDLENELKKVMESRKGVEQALEEIATDRDDALSNLERLSGRTRRWSSRLCPTPGRSRTPRMPERRS
jgi:uncharacterized protein (DUF3084 family)